MPAELRPKIIFNGKSIIPSNLLESIRDSISLYRPVRGNITPISLSAPAKFVEHYFDLMAYDCLESAANQSIVLPRIDAPWENVRHSIVRAHHKNMAERRLFEGFSRDLLSRITTLENYIQVQLRDRGSAEARFLVPALVQVLLEKIVVEDHAESSAFRLMQIAEASGDEFLMAQCQRFANQTAGLSPFAIDQLSRSAEILASASKTAKEHRLYTLEYLAAVQNMYATRLFKTRDSIDVGHADDIFIFASSEVPHYAEMGMLKNSIALSHLLNGNVGRAVDCMDEAAFDNADQLTHLNMSINRLIVRKVGGQSAHNAEIERIFRRYSQLKFTSASGYHPTLAIANLLQLSKNDDLKEEMVKFLLKKQFMSYDESIIREGNLVNFIKINGLLFVRNSDYSGELGSFIDNHGLLPAIHFNWTTPSWT